MNEAPLHLIRPEVRAERAYRVPTAQAAAKLDQNENPYGFSAETKQRILNSWVEANWNRYPDDRPHRLIKALSKHLGHPSEGIIVGNGSNEIVHTIGLAIMGRDVPVVLPQPMFALYGSVARMHGSNVVPVHPKGPHFAHEPEDILRAAVGSEAPLTVITTPNNPTGQSIAFEDIRRIVSEAPGFVLIDEAYYEFVEGPTCETLLAELPNVLVMRTFSKAMGLAGVRLGYLLGTPEVINEIEKARLPFMVDHGAEAIGLAVLDDQNAIKERAESLKSERRRVELELVQLRDVTVIPGSANFFLMQSPLSCEELCSALVESDVRIRNVSGYEDLAPRDGKSGYVRISVGTPEENDRFVASLERIVSAHVA